MGAGVLPGLRRRCCRRLAGWGIRLLLAGCVGGPFRPGVLELAAAVLTGIGVALAWPGPLVALVVWARLLGVALGAVDLVHHRLPDALTLPAIPITAAVSRASSWPGPAPGVH